ncbi:hypothetical protein RRF57_011395 [Xylaria bambusicola]|uniref:Uncharacterized protein n=1 Tax=Xylaria bambusicola TaxID=326684 RepID=A0AAN7UUU2_9PEZI
MVEEFCIVDDQHVGLRAGYHHRCMDFEHRLLHPKHMGYQVASSALRILTFSADLPSTFEVPPPSASMS